MKRISLLMFFFALAPAFAKGSLEPLGKIRSQQDLLAADLKAGTTQGMTPRQVNAIRKAQKEVFAVIVGKNALDELSIDETVRLENALERINAEVKGGRLASDAQEVCWREQKTGSQVKVTRCGTEAERRQTREGARAFMEKAKVCAGECGAEP